MTIEELIKRVAVDLGLTPLNQALPEQHRERIEQGYNEVYAELAVDLKNPWTDIPTAVVPEVALLVCLNCVNTYSISAERLSRFATQAGADGLAARLNIFRKLTPAFVSNDENKYY